MNAKQLRLDQLDMVFLGAASHPLHQRPPVGWLWATLVTLGMISAALGQRLGITASGVSKLEQTEAALNQRSAAS